MPDVTPLLSTDPVQVAGYQLTGRIGAGGQGVVYLGVSPHNELVAVKMLRVEDERSREQFAKEVAAARRVAPFCTAQILDFDLESQPPYVISEFIEGPSLQQYVAERGPLAGTRLQRLAIGTATALAAIHQAGVVHRDLKPANVMMSSEGPRVIDFGIARDLSNDTTKISKLFGTPAYMSPEQLRGERVGPATDLFAWGSVMAFAATGRAPFEAGHMMAAINKIAHEEPDLTGVPPELLTVLRKCFSKDPAHRPSAQHALSMLLGRPDEPDTPDATVVLAEATQLVVASSTGPTVGYAAGATVADPNVRPTQVHRPPTIGATRVERPSVTGAAPGTSGRATGTSGPVSPGVPSGDVLAWGTPTPSVGRAPAAQPGGSAAQWGRPTGPTGGVGASGPVGRGGRPGPPGPSGPQSLAGQGQTGSPGQPGHFGPHGRGGQPAQARYGHPGQPPAPTPPAPGWGQPPQGAQWAPPPSQQPQSWGWGHQGHSGQPVSGPGIPPNNWHAPTPQPWGGGGTGRPTPGAPGNRRRGAVLAGAAAVLTLIAGSGIWNLVQDGNNSDTNRDRSSSSSDGSGKEAADPESCGGRINVGADQGSGDDCARNSGSSEGESQDDSEDDAENQERTAPAGTLPYSLEGVWKGQVSQPAGSTPNWTVRLELKGGKKKTGSMEALGLGCFSNVTVKNAGYSTATLRAPVKDKDNPGGTCVKLGEVILLQNPDDPDRATFTWKDVNNAGNVGLADLTRVE